MQKKAEYEPRVEHIRRRANRLGREQEEDDIVKWIFYRAKDNWADQLYPISYHRPLILELSTTRERCYLKNVTIRYRIRKRCGKGLL